MNANGKVGVFPGQTDGVVEGREIGQQRCGCQDPVAEPTQNASVHARRQPEVVRVDNHGFRLQHEIPILVEDCGLAIVQLGVDQHSARSPHEFAPTLSEVWLKPR